MQSPEDLKNLLQGMGVSQNGIKILKILLNHPEGITARKINKTIRNVDKTTVYRILKGFQKAGLIRKGNQFQSKKYYPAAKKIIIKLESG